MTMYRPCPACGSESISDLPKLAPDPWRIGRCNTCNLVHLRNPVEYEELESEALAWETAYQAEDVVREKKRGPLKRIARAVRNFGKKLRDDQKLYARLLGTGRILDIGCANLLRIGPPSIPYGIELSKSLAESADQVMRARGGYCVQGAGAERIFDFAEEFFDGVVMSSYLEHEVNFTTVLDGAFRTLRSGGRLYIRVPNYSSLNRRISGANWPGFRHPDHVTYFTPDTLKDTVQRAGFEFKLVNRHKIWLDDNIQALAIKPAA